MIQGYDPRTGQPAGDPVPETDGAQVDAIAEAAAAACVPWEQMGPAGRAAALEAVASALDGAADAELFIIDGGLVPLEDRLPHIKNRQA